MTNYAQLLIGQANFENLKTRKALTAGHYDFQIAGPIFKATRLTCSKEMVNTEKLIFEANCPKKYIYRLKIFSPH